MLLAIVCSTIFTFVYAALAAKRRRAEMVLIRALGGGWDTRSLPTREEIVSARLPIDTGQALRVDD
jgi:tripartite-type tricarboxylate transporter receptor subunit TctC